ncbi:MAG: hypothetical protein DRJ45_02045 [Thermoprotei archaeon]|nr:MAG: hypothetical protein DRJ45_02045 [Thermoprotei archaeon]
MLRKAMKVSFIAVFSAMASVLEVFPLDLPFPLFPKLTFDPTGIPLTLAQYMFGLTISIPSTIITGIVIALPRIFKPPNPIGGFFKVCAETSTLIGIFLTKRFWKNSMYRLILSIIGGSFLRTIVMTIINLIFLPIFYGIPEKIVLNILWLIAVFNIIQAIINIVFADILYRALEKRKVFSL